MKTLNIVKQIIVLPFMLIITPLAAISGYFMTDWEKKWDRDFYKKAVCGYWINLFKTMKSI